MSFQLFSSLAYVYMVSIAPSIFDVITPTLLNTRAGLRLCDQVQSPLVEGKNGDCFVAAHHVTARAS